MVQAGHFYNKSHYLFGKKLFLWGAFACLLVSEITVTDRMNYSDIRFMYYNIQLTK